MPTSKSLTSSKRVVKDAQILHIRKLAAEGDHLSLLRDLLAVIHRDGGHYTELAGLDYSVIDAMSAFYDLLEANASLRSQVAQLLKPKKPSQPGRGGMRQ